MRFRRGDNVGPDNVRWAGEKVSEQGGRQRARRLYPGPLECQVGGCSNKRVERHHKDGNTRNNDPSNIAFLCNKHHKEADGRMSRPVFQAARRRKRGTKLTAEHRQRISEGLRGRVFSADTRAKLSGAALARHAKNPKPTTCPSGHLYDEKNTYINKSGVRQCRACNRARARRHYYQIRGVPV